MPRPRPRVLRIVWVYFFCGWPTCRCSKNQELGVGFCVTEDGEDYGGGGGIYISINVLRPRCFFLSRDGENCPSSDGMPAGSFCRPQEALVCVKYGNIFGRFLSRSKTEIWIGTVMLLPVCSCAGRRLRWVYRFAADPSASFLLSLVAFPGCGKKRGWGCLRLREVFFWTSTIFSLRQK